MQAWRTDSGVRRHGLRQKFHAGRHDGLHQCASQPAHHHHRRPDRIPFPPKKCIISQREIGLDVPVFPTALRYVVRQDPDCILIGEMRDRETMLAAIQAAETGHLVLGSLHCSDAATKFSRILEFFPRTNTLSSDRRWPTAWERSCANVCSAWSGTVPATEVLLTNSIVSEKIITKRTKTYRPFSAMPRRRHAGLYVLPVRAGKRGQDPSRNGPGLRPQPRGADLRPQRHRYGQLRHPVPRAGIIPVGGT